MGDSCNVTLTVRAKDARKWERAFKAVYGDKSKTKGMPILHGLEDEDHPLFQRCESAEERNNGAYIDLEFPDENYGLDEFCRKAAKLGAVFIGHHGEGYEYHGALFCASNKKIERIATVVGGDEAVRLDLNESLERGHAVLAAGAAESVTRFVRLWKKINKENPGLIPE